MNKSISFNYMINKQYLKSTKPNKNLNLSVDNLKKINILSSPSNINK